MRISDVDIGFVPYERMLASLLTMTSRMCLSNSGLGSDLPVASLFVMSSAQLRVSLTPEVGKTMGAASLLVVVTCFVRGEEAWQEAGKEWLESRQRGASEGDVDFDAGPHGSVDTFKGWIGGD